MARVPPRSFLDFPIRRVIIEKVVDRRLGFEADEVPEGWKWDHRHLVSDRIAETLPNPGLKGSHLLSIPRSYWQNGPVSGGIRDSLKVKEVQSILARGRKRWTPIIHRGDVNIWRDSSYFFSDDSRIETVDWADVAPSGSSLHACSATVRSGSPIAACIYRRVDGEYLPWRNYTRRQRFTGLISDGEELQTRDRDVIYWDNIDTTRREFISYVREGAMYLLFNKHVGEQITSLDTISDIHDFNGLEYLGDSTGVNSEVFQSEYLPISDDAYLEVYVVNVSGDTWEEYTIVDSFTGANQVKVDTDLGYVTFGSTEDGADPPPVGRGVYLRYRAVPRVEYEEEGHSDVSVAVTADVNPLGQSLNRGFVVLARAELDIARIVLETTKPSYRSTFDAYGPVYVGSDYAPLIATVYSTSGEVVPNVEVTFEIVTTPSFGSIAGSGDTAQRMTGADGKARTFYVPPVSADALGTFVLSVGSGNTLTVGSGIYFEDPEDIYTYYILKDDPFQGKVGADTSIGEIEWSASPPNGRRVVLYGWDATAINPVSGELGAYAPVRPATITDGNILTYTDTLEDPEPVGSTKNLGAYWIVSDRYITLQASAWSPRYRRTITSNELILRVALPDHMKGSYINSSLQEIPFGWRLPDDSYTVASALDGATYITINPVAGPYPIVDIIGGETWDYTETYWPSGAYPYPEDSVSAPFARFSIFWDIDV